ncbi:DUF305 domain-containing protein [soil metagenome]
MNQRRIRISFIAMPVLAIASGLLLAPHLRSAPAPKAKAGSESAFMRENMVAMDRMMAGMNVPSSGDVDRDFTRMMIPHHQGAIDMAQSLLRYGKNKELRALALAIIEKQRAEIAMMRRIVVEKAPAAAPSGHHHSMPMH